MWTFIIIFVVLFLGKFIVDSLKQSNEIKKQGGIKKKYSKLVQMLLEADPRTRILQESNNFINIGISGPAGAQSYFLQETFGSLTVQVVVKNNPLLGNLTIERSFPEDMDQEEMLKELIKAQQEEMTKKLSRYQ